MFTVFWFNKQNEFENRQPPTTQSVSVQYHSLSSTLSFRLLWCYLSATSQASLHFVLGRTSMHQTFLVWVAISVQKVVAAVVGTNDHLNCRLQAASTLSILALPPLPPILPWHGKIRLTESNAKCGYLKNLTCKGTLWQVFIFLSPPPLLGFCLGW